MVFPHDACSPASSASTVCHARRHDSVGHGLQPLVLRVALLVIRLLGRDGRGGAPVLSLYRADELAQ